MPTAQQQLQEQPLQRQLSVQENNNNNDLLDKSFQGLSIKTIANNNSTSSMVLTDSPSSATGILPEETKDLVLEKSFYTFDDFTFTFEQIFDDPESRAIFKQYVDKVSRSSELLLFSESVESFKLLKSHTNKKEKAEEILKTFLKPMAKLEINIGDDERQAAIAKVKVSLQQNTIDSDLFDKPLTVVLCLLQQDIFSRFVRSEMFRQFVSKKPLRYVLTIGTLNEKGIHRKNLSKCIIDLAPKRRFIPLPFSENNCFGTEDLNVLMELAANQMDWKLLTSSQTSGSKEFGYSSAFVSKHKFVFSEKDDHGKRIFKANGILPLSLSQTATLLSNPQLKPLYENNLQSSQLLQYHHMSTVQNPFAESILLENFPMTWPIYNRDFVVRATAFFHSPTQEYIFLKKSTQLLSMQERKGTIRGQQWMGWVLSKVSEQLTRYVHVMFMDMSTTNQTSDKIWSMICAKRFKFLHGNLTKAVKQFSTKFEDTEGIYTCLMENTQQQQLKRDHSMSSSVTLQESNSTNNTNSTTTTTLFKELCSTDASKYQFSSKTLKRIIYISKYASQVTEADLEQIGKSSVANNQLFHITGILLCTNSVFYQVIEGEPHLIEYVYDKILRDPRHTDAKCLKEEFDLQETDRQFPNWSMNTINLDIQDHYFAEVIRKLIQQVSKSSKLTAASAKERPVEKCALDEKNIVEEIVKVNGVTKNIFETSSLVKNNISNNSSSTEYTETDGTVSDDEEEDL